MPETQVERREVQSQPSVQAERFYRRALKAMNDSEVPFMVGGAYAMRQYAGIFRDTKDFDVFCKAGDYPRLLQALAEIGCRQEVSDASWIAKAFQGEYFVDLIFGSGNGTCPVDDTWFERAPTVEIMGTEVKLIPAEEMIWSKSMVQDRFRYDGADVNHVIRAMGDQLDWQHLLMRMESIWEVLLAHLINFRFVFPSDRDLVPHWLMEELLTRVQQQLVLPTPQDRICRGYMFTKTQYEVDIRERGYRER